MIVTAHQINFLPGESVVSKIEASDAVIWLDEVQYTKNGWIARNRVEDTWLTVPISKVTDGEAINRVRIAEHGDWRYKMAATITQRFRGECGGVVDEILRPYRLLVGLNAALMRRVTRDVMTKDTAWHWQSHLDGGRVVPAVSMDQAELLPISQRLAMMVGEVGGSVYLSGPSGRNYLDEAPFVERGITVRYWSFDRANRCCLYRYL